MHQIIFLYRKLVYAKEYLKTDFVSIFINTITSELKEDLSQCAHKLWNILMLSYVDKNSDTVYYHYEDAICSQSLSKATYYKAVKELIKYQFIAKHKKLPFTYYVNPKYFYNGDRLNIINEIRKIWYIVFISINIMENGIILIIEDILKIIVL